LHDVIVIDDDDKDSDDLVIIGEKVCTSNKGKTIESTHEVESVESQRSGHGLNLSLGIEASKSENLSKSFQSKIKSTSLVDNPDVGKLLHAGKKPAATESKCANQEGSSSSSCHANCKDEITRKFQSFKQFDIIDYCYSYVRHYAYEKSSTKPVTLCFLYFQKPILFMLLSYLYQSKNVPIS
jgi:hypothetical protein